MKKVLLVASDPSELKGFGDEWIKCICGVGPISSATYSAIFIERYKPDVVFSLGSAGSLGRFKRGDVVSFSTIVTPDQNLSSMHLSLGTTIGSNRATFKELYTADKRSGYILYTSGTFNKEKVESHYSLHSDATDMEAYGVALSATVLSVPFFAVKLITDTVGDNSTIGDISHFYREGRERIKEKVLSLLE